METLSKRFNIYLGTSSKCSHTHKKFNTKPSFLNSHTYARLLLHARDTNLLWRETPLVTHSDDTATPVGWPLHHGGTVDTSLIGVSLAGERHSYVEGAVFKRKPTWYSPTYYKRKCSLFCKLWDGINHFYKMRLTLLTTNDDSTALRRASSFRYAMRPPVNVGNRAGSGPRKHNDSAVS